MKENKLIKQDLAINGGKPIRTKPWLDNITTGKEEKQALMDVMDSGYMSMFEGSFTPDLPFRFDGGPWVRKLEKVISDKLTINYVVSVNSATSGLYSAIGALGIGYGDEVIVSPYTMSACATAPMIYGAIPVFADVEIETGSLSVESIAQCITSRTKAIILVHQFGIPADLDGIMALADQYDIKVIEDCAQAWGAEYKGCSVGTIGDIGVFSFNVNKTLQSGEGGVCVTNNEDLSYRLQLIRNHAEAVVGPADYNNITNMVGFNYRMTELQAAVAYTQFLKLPELNSKRLELVDHLIKGLEPYEFLSFPKREVECLSTYYVVPILYHQEKFYNIPRETFIEAINAEGICFYQGYVEPLYLQPIYQKRQAFKFGYPWAAPENKASQVNYSQGICPHAEMLHTNKMIINEHIRPPQQLDDINDILYAVDKVVTILGF